MLLFKWLTHHVSIPQDEGWGVRAPAPQTDYRSWLSLSGGSEHSSYQMLTTHSDLWYSKDDGDRGEEWSDQTLRGFDPSRSTHQAPFTLFLLA